jgi:hypothetical protein
MFANSGKVTFEELLKSLYDKSNPVVRFYKAILANCRENYILNIMAKVLKGEEPAYDRSGELKDIWDNESIWAKLAIWKPLALFMSKWDKDLYVKSQVDKILNLVMPGVIPEHLKTVS